MRKLICFMISAFLLLTFCGCVSESLETTDHWGGDESVKYSDAPYRVVEEGQILTNEEIRAIVSLAPTNRYEEYPELHTAPITAMLYKGGEEAALDVNDKRIVGLMNLYNNSVCYGQYSYTQGLLPIDEIEKYSSEEFRLVLTFEPDKETPVTGYDTNVLRCDTFIITNKWFVIIAHDSPGYEGEEDRYPYAAYGHSPLHLDYPWLDLFGF